MRLPVGQVRIIMILMNDHHILAGIHHCPTVASARIDHPVIPACPANCHGRQITEAFAREDKIITAHGGVQPALAVHPLAQSCIPAGRKIECFANVQVPTLSHHQEARRLFRRLLRRADEFRQQENICIDISQQPATAVLASQVKDGSYQRRAIGVAFDLRQLANAQFLRDLCHAVFFAD